MGDKERLQELLKKQHSLRYSGKYWENPAWKEYDAEINAIRIRLATSR